MIRVLLIPLLAIAGVAAQSPAPPPQPVMVILETEKGTIEIEVNLTKAPITAENFLKYVDGGFYDGGRFTRTVRPDTENRTDFPIQVIQATVSPARALSSSNVSWALKCRSSRFVMGRGRCRSPPHRITNAFSTTTADPIRAAWAPSRRVHSSMRRWKRASCARSWIP